VRASIETVRSTSMSTPPSGRFLSKPASINSWLSSICGGAHVVAMRGDEGGWKEMGWDGIER
jgi:hypothetical protein